MIHYNIGINEFLLRSSWDKGDLLPTIKAPAIRDTKVKRFVKFPISENLAIPMHYLRGRSLTYTFIVISYIEILGAI